MGGDRRGVPACKAYMICSRNAKYNKAKHSKVNTVALHQHLVPLELAAIFVYRFLLFLHVYGFWGSLGLGFSQCQIDCARRHTMSHFYSQATRSGARSLPLVPILELSGSDARVRSLPQLTRQDHLTAAQVVASETLPFLCTCMPIYDVTQHPHKGSGFWNSLTHPTYIWHVSKSSLPCPHDFWNSSLLPAQIWRLCWNCSSCPTHMGVVSDIPSFPCPHMLAYMVLSGTESLTHSQAHAPGTWRAINARKHLHTCHSSVILSKTTECIAKLYTHLAVLYLVHMQLLWSKNKKRALSCI